MGQTKVKTIKEVRTKKIKGSYNRYECVRCHKRYVQEEFEGIRVNACRECFVDFCRAYIRKHTFTPLNKPKNKKKR